MQRAPFRVAGVVAPIFASLVLLAAPAVADSSPPTGEVVGSSTPTSDEEVLPEPTPTVEAAAGSAVPSLPPPTAPDPEGGPPPPSLQVSLAATPTVTVTPSTGLRHGDRVTVAGSGFTPNASIGVAQCRADAVGAVGCDLGTVTSLLADGSGAWSTGFTVRRITDPGSGAFDCNTPPGRHIGAANIASPGFAESSFTAIEFTDEPPPPPPTIAIEPNDDLGYFTSATVTGSGFVSGEPVNIVECPATGGSAPGACVPLAFTFADASGEIDHEVTLRRLIGFLPEHIDCIDLPGCVIAVQPFGGSLAPGNVALSFDPTVPQPPPPTITIEPSGPLTHLQRIDIVGSGFAPNSFLSVRQCVQDAFECNFASGFAETDATGSFTIDDFMVQRVVGTHAAEFTDCLDEPCVLRIQGFDPLSSAELLLSFADVPLPPTPQVTVDPSTDLAESQSVNVSGSGFGPGLTVNVVQCSADSTFFDFDCNFGPVVNTDGDGSFETTTTVSRFILAFPTPIDCAQPGRCVVAAFSYDDVLSSTGIPIAFDPEPDTSPPIVGGSIEGAGASGSATLPVTGPDATMPLRDGLAILAIGIVLVAISRAGLRRKVARELDA